MNLSRIKCPYCGEEIAPTAKKCRFCNEWLPASGTAGQTQQPVTPQVAPQQQAYQQTGYMQSQQQPMYQQPAYQQAPMQQPVYQPLTQTPPPIAQTPLQQPINTDTTHPLNDTPEIDTSTLPSFFEEYFVKPYIRQYADFKSCTGRKAFWLAVLALLIVNTGVTGVAMLIIGLSGMSMGTLLAAGIICGLWSLAMIVPGIAIGCRRLRDAGKSPWLYLLSLIPLVGPIVLLVFWCQASEYEDTDYYAEFKPVDTAVTAISLVLFIGSIIAFNSSFDSLTSGMDDYVSEYSLAEDDEYSESDDESSSIYDDFASTSTKNEAAQPVTYTNYSGIIDGKYKIRMMLNSDGHGEYYYTKNGPDATLTLIITELDDNGKIKIEEYNDNGEQTGLFEGRMDNSGDIKGWFTNYKGKQMPFYLEQINGD